MDLSEAFGRPATTSLRGLLPRRDDAGNNGSTAEPARSDLAASAPDRSAPDRSEPAPAAPDPASSAAVPAAPEPSDDVPTATATPDVAGAPVDVPAPRSPGRIGRGGRSGSTGHPATAGGTATNRRWGVARVASRDHVDLLVLLAVRHGPTDGRGVITRLRDTSGGLLDAPERTVHATLHRLARNRLLARRPGHDSGRDLYSLTPAGERAARSRLREWQALTRCMDAVSASDAPS